MEGEAHTRREEKALPKEHPATGKRFHGIRRRTRQHKDADKISEDIERYPSTTRFIESSLGIKSYSIEILHWVDSVLEPLKEKMRSTDSLIDQIVYKLYGLTDEEIVTVEGHSHST